ncbi:sensor histidine kinase [Pseudokineococcus sp. 1T1Z-3]|uniref:sensor histidine kinase n=1 Tax=Pseudokineococcus sp. 1T1Z-3 TaxID=3132745 RepID=UPI0030994DE8
MVGWWRGGSRRSKTGAGVLDRPTRPVAVIELVWLGWFTVPLESLAASGRGPGVVVAGFLLVAVFAVGYVLAVLRPPAGWAGSALVVALSVMAAVGVGAFGELWVGHFVFVAVAAAVLVVRFDVARGVVLAVAVLTGLLVALTGQSLPMAGGLAFVTAAVGISVVGARRSSWLMEELRQARQSLAAAAVDEERLRFARDLHDMLGGGLTLVSLKAATARRQLQRDPAAAEAELVQLEEISGRVLEECRASAAGYRRVDLADELAIVRALLPSSGLAVDVADEVARRVESLPAAQSELLGRVLREAVVNVVRHGQATTCSVSLVETPAGAVVMTVDDDGVGPGARVREGAQGLSGLRERARALGGDVVVGPAPGGGFRLRCRLALAEPSVGAR